ncbi:MAG TPA: PAS domain S-box protein [Gammaproteobacteria bacterium]|nr:PAS domain S-box protein [Gammaproteobacteria bacterium]
MDSQGLFDIIMDSAVLLDKSGHIINWNMGASATFGYNKKEALGRSINLIYDRNYFFPKLIQEAQSQQKKWQAETVFVRKNGVKGTCKSYLHPLRSQENNKIAAILFHHNVTALKNTEKDNLTTISQIENKLKNVTTQLWDANMLLSHRAQELEQVERKLRESELRFHLLAENTMDVISRHTPEGAYLYASPASETALGFKAEELIKKNIYKLIHYDDIPKLRKLFTKRRESSYNKPVVYRIKRKEGEFRWFESHIRLIINETTKAINEIQLASRDITDRVLDKKARLRGQQLAHVFRLSTMEEMASGMAHEISQPLAAIVNYTRGCVRHLQNNEHDHYQITNIMEKAAIQAERAGEIVQRLKNFFCKGQLVKTQCKMNNVIKETISFIKNELTLSKTKVECHLDKSTPMMFIDKIQIQQVLLNLIQNAMDAMTENHHKERRIYIETKTISSDIIEVKLFDTGPGFSKEAINKVFTPFYTTKAHGRGMGLAICRSIIEAHGGQFTINPNTEDSSWIAFSLPISV